MYMFYILATIFFVLGIILKMLNKNKINESINNYLVLTSPMTKTELIFCKELKKITDKYNLLIIPQIQLQKIFKVYNKKDISSFNKIKAKSIDFAIVDNNYNYKMFIELDDYTHNKSNRIKRDIFINELFKKYNYKLIRIKVQNNYNIEELENIIKEVAN